MVHAISLLSKGLISRRASRRSRPKRFGKRMAVLDGFTRLQCHQLNPPLLVHHLVTKHGIHSSFCSVMCETATHGTLLRTWGAFTTNGASVGTEVGDCIALLAFGVFRYRCTSPSSRVTSSPSRNACLTDTNRCQRHLPQWTPYDISHLQGLLLVRSFAVGACAEALVLHVCGVCCLCKGCGGFHRNGMATAYGPRPCVVILVFRGWQGDGG